MGYIIIYNQQHMRKNLQSKIIFIKTLDISTSVENTTFIKYALISKRIEYAITPPWSGIVRSVDIWELPFDGVYNMWTEMEI